MAKFPFLAHIRTEFGGGDYKRFRTFEEAVEYLRTVTTVKGFKGKKIKVVDRWVTDTRGNELYRL